MDDQDRATDEKLDSEIAQYLGVNIANFWYKTPLGVRFQILNANTSPVSGIELFCIFGFWYKTLLHLKCCKEDPKTHPASDIGPFNTTD